MKKRRRKLVEQLWRSSNLTWQEAEQLIDDAIRLGKFTAWEKHGNKRAGGNVAA